jgi:hypothetical protein
MKRVCGIVEHESLCGTRGNAWIWLVDSWSFCQMAGAIDNYARYMGVDVDGLGCM